MKIDLEAEKMKDMSDEDYEGYRKIVWDDGGFHDDVEIIFPTTLEAYKFWIEKMRRLDEYQRKHGRARKIVMRTENKKDWRKLRFFYSEIPRRAEDTKNFAMCLTF
jgi:hypothetical protein